MAQFLKTEACHVGHLQLFKIEIGIFVNLPGFAHIILPGFSAGSSKIAKLSGKSRCPCSLW